MYNKMSGKTNFHSLTLTQDAQRNLVKLYSTYAIQSDTIQGELLLEIPHDNRRQSLTAVLGDYEEIQGITVAERVFVVYSAYQNRSKAIFLEVVDADGTVHQHQLTSWGRFSSPIVCEHDNALHIFWTRFGADASIIETIVLPLNTDWATLPVTVPVTEATERAYAPQAVSDGETLFLVYESFYEHRYHLMLRLRPQTHTAFGAGVEIGFDCWNDLSPALCCFNGTVTVTWENTRPLDTDYVWESPEGDRITMPAFGHGWQVCSTIGVRSLAFENGQLTVSALGVHADWNAPASLHNEESAGEPVIFRVRDALLIAYVTKANQHYWQVVLQHSNGEAWQPVTIPEIRYDYRQKPILTVTGDRLCIAGIRIDGEARENDLFEISLAWLENTPSPIWTACKSIAYDSFISTMTSNQPNLTQTIETKNESLHLYWGDLHMHSNLSLCSLHPKFHCTELASKHRFSRDVGQLDFNLLTDHQVMDDYEWLQSVKYAHLHSIENGFVSFVGFEWTSSMLKDFHNYGHYNVLFADEGPLMRIHDGTYDTIDKVWRQMEKTPGLTIPHHPGEKVHPLDWDYFNPRFEPLVEMFQVRGSYEADDCELHPEAYGREITTGNSIQTGLRKGYRFGFTSGGEHEGVGITAVYADELTRAGICEALQKRQVYGTTGARILLDFRVNGALMGREILVQDESVEISIRVTGTQTIESVHLVSSTSETRLEIPAGQRTLALDVQQPLAHQHDWFYVRVKQSDGAVAWSSPVWVDCE